MAHGIALRSPEETTGFSARRNIDDSPGHRVQVDRAVDRAKEGDRDALRFLYLTFSGNVYGYVKSIVRDEHEAEDITQHVFANLITAIRRYDRRGVPFSGWLMRLAHNAAIDHLRRRRATCVESVHGADERDDDEANERRRCLNEALETLPEDQRGVVVMRHVMGLSPTEIAGRLGRSESSVHGLHHRGRRALRAELQRLECSPSTAGTA